MTLTQIKYVIAVAESGSFNKASQLLYISQPSLSNAIQELEKELGITIFYRSGKGVALTNEGIEYLTYARQLFNQYEELLSKYGKNNTIKKKFGISTQHYSFAVKSFVAMVKKFDTTQYEFAIRETKTKEVITNVNTLKSEIGIIYISNFNKNFIQKILNSYDLLFYPIIECEIYVYLYKKHPLAKKKQVSFKELEQYPSLSFEQGDSTSFYFAEEIYSTKEYLRTIKVNDRATMLNLMKELYGFTLCSGIISEDLNGGNYIAIPLMNEEEEYSDSMKIGYIIKKNHIMSKMAKLYIDEIKNYFESIGLAKKVLL
ncbi:MAG: LysR family transcriptional regulator [Succinivibrionaceae bacterium]